MWVETGDAAGTRYFIPNRGVDSRTHVAEALTQMTAERRKAQNRNLDPSRASDEVRGAIGATANGLAVMVLGLDRIADQQNPSYRSVWEEKPRR
jgi:hypothetical protein